MNKKVIVSTLAISALAVNIFAQESNLGGHYEEERTLHAQH